MYEAIGQLTALQEAMLADLDEADKAIVTQWVGYVCLLNPSVMMRPDVLVEVVDKIFGSSVITNYVLDLTFRFYSLSGNTNTFAQDLATNLAEGLSLDGPDVDYCLIPEDLKQSMPTSLYPSGKQLSLWNRLLEILGIYRPTKTRSILLSNKHLVVVLLLHIANTSRPSIPVENKVS